MLRSLSRITRTILLWSLGRSDYRRWRDACNLEAWWETRTQKIAVLIPKGTRVIEFGCGRRWLESYLDSSCSYIPSDLVDRGDGTFICDLNQRPLPDLNRMRPDVAVFIGVLEYVKDLTSIALWLSRQVNSCVASYACASTRPGMLRRVIEAVQRAKLGYMTAYSEPELIEIFAQSGFRCMRVETWNEQRLFLFQGIRSIPPQGPSRG